MLTVYISEEYLKIWENCSIANIRFLKSWIKNVYHMYTHIVLCLLVWEYIVKNLLLGNFIIVQTL